MNTNQEPTEVSPSTKQDSQADATTPPARDEKGRLLPGVQLNPTGAGGFGDHPENRSNGSWKKEDTPRGKLEKLLNNVSVGEFFNQVKEQNVDTNEGEMLGDVLMSGLLANSFVEDPDSNGKLKVNSKELTSLLYFVYGSKSENDTNIRTDDGVPIIKGFVIPTAPADFIDDSGHQRSQD